MVIVGTSDNRLFDEELHAVFVALNAGGKDGISKADFKPWTDFLEDAYREYGCNRWGFDPVSLSSMEGANASGALSWDEFRRWQYQWLSTLSTKDMSKAALLCWLAQEVLGCRKVREVVKLHSGDDAGLIRALPSVSSRGPASKEVAKALEPVHKRLKQRLQDASQAGDMAAWKVAAALAKQAKMPRPDLEAAEAQLVALREAQGIPLQIAFPSGERACLWAFPNETVGDLKKRLLAARGNPGHVRVRLAAGARQLENVEWAGSLDSSAPLLALLSFDTEAIVQEADRLVDGIRRFKEAVAEVSCWSKPPVPVRMSCEVLLCLLAGQEGACARAPRLQEFASGGGSVQFPRDLSLYAAYQPMLKSPGLYAALKAFPHHVAANEIPSDNFEAARFVNEASWQDSRGGVERLSTELLSRMSQFSAVMVEWTRLMLKLHDIVSPSS